jgi:serpin B
LSESFQHLLHDQYGAAVNQIDLTGWPGDFDPVKAIAARAEINSWAASQTHDKIQEIVPVNLPGESTRLLLVSTIWLKGSWASPFDRAHTTNSLFQLGSGESVLVPTMHLTANFRLAESDDVQVLDLPYSSNRLSMLLILPRKSDGLGELEKVLTPARITKLQQTGRSQKVSISLPRFKSRSGLALVQPLQALGIKDAFSASADFSGITPTKPFFIEDVFHKAYLEVDEEGAEAAAGTGLSFVDSFPETFNANHPFLFLIRDNQSGIILFLGRVVNPAQL